MLEDLGINPKIPEGYKKIRVHFVYNVKHDGKYKARLVAGGHLTEVLCYSVTSSVVSLRGLRIAIFIAELNGLQVWATDVGNAYLEAPAQEKVYIIGGTKFRDRVGHTMLIRKALYGLRSSGLRWWDRCSEILVSLGFQATLAEDDIWIKRVGIHYGYIVRYVDDLGIVSKDSEGIIKTIDRISRTQVEGHGSH